PISNAPLREFFPIRSFQRRPADGWGYSCPLHGLPGVMTTMSSRSRSIVERGWLLSLPLLLLAACGSPTSQQPAATPDAAPATARPAFEPGSVAPLEAGGYRVLVTNERSGDLTVIDGPTRQVLATVPLGKRPRGLKLRSE